MNLWDIVGWLVIGGLAGWIAGMIMNRGGSVLMNIIVGIVGAVIGGFLARALNIGGAPSPNDPVSWYSFIVALVGAVILLAILKLISGRRA